MDEKSRVKFIIGYEFYVKDSSVTFLEHNIIFVRAVGEQNEELALRHKKYIIAYSKQTNKKSVC